MKNKLSKSNDKFYVTVYIPCFGYEDFIEKAVLSLINQSFIYFKCIIFILKSDKQAKRIILKLVDDDERFSISELENKPSLQSLGNQVLNKCFSEYILRLDADDTLDEFGLEILITAAKKDKNLAMVWGCFYYCSADGELYNISPYKTLLSNRKDPPHGACTLIRTSALRSISGYDESINSQDGFDIWQRLKSIYKVKGLPQVIFYYTQHNKSLSKSKSRMNLSSNLLNKRKVHSLSGSLKKNFLVIVGIKEFYNSRLKKNFIEELEINSNGENKIQEIIKLTKSISTETNLVISTTTNKVFDYCNSIRKKNDTFIVSLREDNSNNNVPLLNILRHGLEEYIKSYDHLPSMLIFINTHHSDLPSKEDFDNSWLKLTCSSNSMYMPVESIREVILSKKSAELEILNPGRFKDIYPAHEKLCKWKENFLCCTPDSILHDYLFSSVASD